MNMYSQSWPINPIAHCIGAIMFDFDATALACAPNVAVATLRAMATVESSLNPYAIGVVGGRLQRQPRTLLEGVSTAQALKAQNIKFSAGLIQIYVKNWPAYNLDHETVFEPCANMRAAQGILANCYQRASIKTQEPQIALRKAISCYYSNNFVTGFNHGYVQKVVAAALNFSASAQKTAIKGT
jgi:type IV secretion system protein VirB1